MSGDVMRHHRDLPRLWTAGDSWERLEDLGHVAQHHAQRADERAEAPRAEALLLVVEYLDAVARQADRMTTRTVLEARAAGASWQAIGAQLGITRQAATKRFGGIQ